MNNFNNIPQDKMAGILNMAAKQMGRDPQQLRRQLENGNVDQVLNGLDPKTAGKINSLLQDPSALQAMLQTDKVKNMLNGLLNNMK